MILGLFFWGFVSCYPTLVLIGSELNYLPQAKSVLPMTVTDE